MNRKKLIIIAFIISIFHFQSVFCQIEKEIINYVDSTELIVRNGRKMLAENLQNDNFQKAGEIFEYLTNLSESLNSNIFNSNEELDLLRLFEKWDVFLLKVKPKDIYKFPIYPENFGNYYYRNSMYNRLNDVIHSKLMENAEDILANLTNNNSLTQEEKDFIYLTFTQFLYTDNTVKYKEFKKNYPHSEYRNLIKGYLPQPDYNVSMTFGGGAESLFPDGNLKQYFSNELVGHFYWDFNINRAYLSFDIKSGQIALQKNFSRTTPYIQYDFIVGDKFTYTDVGLTGGYLVVRNKWLHIAPTVKIGGGSITSKLFKDEDDEYKIYDSFTFAPGLHTEWKICKLNSNESSYLSLKLDGGYNIVASYKYKEAKGNMPYINLGLSFGLGDFKL